MLFSQTHLDVQEYILPINEDVTYEDYDVVVSYAKVMIELLVTINTMEDNLSIDPRLATISPISSGTDHIYFNIKTTGDVLAYEDTLYEMKVYYTTCLIRNAIELGSILGYYVVSSATLKHREEQPICYNCDVLTQKMLCKVAKLEKTIRFNRLPLLNKLELTALVTSTVDYTLKMGVKIQDIIKKLELESVVL